MNLHINKTTPHIIHITNRGINIMIWIYILIGMIISFLSGMTFMYYKDRDILRNQKSLHNELQNNKMKLNEYQKELNNHFTCNIQLLNKMAENYRQLYQNMTKTANFFLPNLYVHNNLHTLDLHEKHTNDEQLPITAPLDYSNNSKK